jgi:hypothetical protein
MSYEKIIFTTDAMTRVTSLIRGACEADPAR